MFDRLEPLLPKINLFLKNVGEAFTLEDLKNFIGLRILMIILWVFF